MDKCTNPEYTINLVVLMTNLLIVILDILLLQSRTDIAALQHRSGSLRNIIYQLLTADLILPQKVQSLQHTL